MKEETPKRTAAQEKLWQKKRAAVEKDLQSEEDVVVIAALKQAYEYGDAALIPALAKLVSRDPSPEVRKELEKLFFGLKSSQVVPVLVQEAAQVRDPQVKAFLVSAIWESGLNGEPVFESLLDMALQGDYRLALEVLTVVENMSRPAEDQRLLDATRKIKEYLGKNPPEETVPLFQAMVEVLSELLIEG